MNAPRPKWPGFYRFCEEIASPISECALLTVDFASIFLATSAIGHKSLSTGSTKDCQGRICYEKKEMGLEENYNSRASPAGYV